MTSKKSQRTGCCAQPSLKDRSLMTPIQAGGLAAVFKVLANDTRLRLLHALVRAGEMCVTDLADAVGMRPQAVSNQLQRLLDLGILATRREGNSIYYKPVDRCAVGLLEQGWCMVDGASAPRGGVFERAAACCGGDGTEADG